MVQQLSNAYFEQILQYSGIQSVRTDKCQIFNVMLLLNCPYGLPGVSCGFKHNNEVEESGMASNMDCGPI